MATGFLPGVRLPEDVERGALGGPMFNTTVLSLDSGFEKRNINWSQARGEWDVGYGLMLKFQEEGFNFKFSIDTLIQMFYTVSGKAFSFRFKDWSDFELGRQNGTDIAAQFLAFGDGVTVNFQAFKRYSFPPSTQTYDRVITKFVPDTLEVFLDDVLQTEGVDYTADDDRGIITFTTPPGGSGSGGNGPLGEEVVTFRVDFDVHARFDTDKLDVNMEIYNVGQWRSIPIVEIRGNGLD